ncbi:MAG: 1-acyl-sn-glycerol-3-phosphate acyltransferase [Hyphomonadaceae bacterium]|jgi:1-acyl-sn-glycerol-3-phosphate acyltransferase|nr:1-acyl-sn-glycerol-3-phosphate acyltransferase [Hyphomonadaceae bacterium]
MLWLRSLLFMIWHYGSIAVIGLVCAPLALFDPKFFYVGARAWARATMIGLRLFCGITWSVEGRDLIPDEPGLVASKHHSALDTIVPFLIFERPTFVLKQELLSMPVFGWYARHIGIAIDRDGAMSALKKMVGEAKARVAAGSPVIIFPEGTRQQVGAPPDYKPGVAAIYGMIGLDCLPVAHNGGLCWPASGLIKRPGHVTFQILPVIPKGLKRHDFMDRLQGSIETATGKLVSDARTETMA